MSDLKMLDKNRSEENISNVTRAKWKSLIKGKFRGRVEDNLKYTNITRLRFIKHSKFGIKSYIKDRDRISLLKLKFKVTIMKKQ